MHRFASSSIEMIITRGDKWMHISEVGEKIECFELSGAHTHLKLTKS